MRRFLIALALVAGACHPPPSSTEATQVAAAAAAVGVRAPDGPIATADGHATTLAQAIAGHPQTVLVFYRGFY